MDTRGTTLKTSELLTTGQLQRIMPQAPENLLGSFLIEFNKQFPVYNLTTPLRIAAFIAQGAHESGELRSLVENMNYSAPRIMQVWPARFHSIEEATPYAHNPAKLGNNVYANRMGNGDPSTGDGYKFRGRGWFNGTGKIFYQKMAKLSGANFVGNPDLIATPHYAVLSALVEWKTNNLNLSADNRDFKHITKVINGGYIGLAQRTAYYNKAKLVFGIK
jgi:putative chitinase